MMTYNIEIHLARDNFYKEIIHICKFTLDYKDRVTYNNLKSDAYKHISTLKGIPKEAVCVVEFNYEEKLL